jgi:hypothetical protein
VPTLFVCLVKVLFATCRIRVHGQRYRDELRERDIPVVGSIWHYAIIYILYYMRKENGVAMVSASKDGEYISRIAQKTGFTTVRGSRNKDGVKAMKAMIRYMKQGRDGAIVADGSQGPARIAQAGPIVLASRAGAAVLPMLWSCNRYKRLGSWDGTSLPMPFSRIDFFFGEPFDVPPKIKSEEIEEYRLLLENRLNDLYRKAWALQGKIEH